ncbi:hypothetical protein EBR96_09245, partial [bacterium]|nr:hypothetical protein [bacterium]
MASNAPLADRKIVLLRSGANSKIFVDSATAAGATVLCRPLQTYTAIKSGLDQLTSDRISEFDWIIFTSATSVRFFATNTNGLLVAKQKQIGAVGASTQAA